MVLKSSQVCVVPWGSDGWRWRGACPSPGFSHTARPEETELPNTAGWSLNSSWTQTLRRTIGFFPSSVAAWYKLAAWEVGRYQWVTLPSAAALFEIRAFKNILLCFIHILGWAGLAVTKLLHWKQLAPASSHCEITFWGKHLLIDFSSFTQSRVM